MEEMRKNLAARHFVAVTVCGEKIAVDGATPDQIASDPIVILTITTPLHNDNGAIPSGEISLIQ
jgi:hypothetical protein